MILRRTTRSALLALGAAMLLAALVFLFAKTAAIDFKHDAQALAFLREMKDLDTRWDADALRIVNELGAVPAAMPERGRLIGRALRELENNSGGADLVAQVRGLRSALS